MWHQIKHTGDYKDHLPNNKAREICLSKKDKIFFSDWKWKILILFKQIFDQSIFLIVCHFTTNTVLKSTNIKSMQRKVWGILCLISLTVFCFPETVLITEILLSISLTDSSLTSFLFTWFAKRFRIHPFPFNIIPYIVNIIKRCYSFCSQLFL